MAQNVALRVRTKLATDASLIMRTLGQSRRILVAASALATSIGNACVADLANLPTLSSTDEPGETEWQLAGPNDARHTIRHQPRMTCGDFDALRDAAAGSLGVALSPDHVCGADLRAGRLIRVFPGWGGQKGIAHLVFTTRRGLPPAVRAFIDHVAKSFAGIRLEA